MSCEVFSGSHSSCAERVQCTTLVSNESSAVAESGTLHVMVVRNALFPAADGDEGGRHQLINAAVSNGNLYILKVQVGDKRWFKVRHFASWPGMHLSFIAWMACMHRGCHAWPKRCSRTSCIALG